MLKAGERAGIGRAEVGDWRGGGIVVRVPAATNVAVPVAPMHQAGGAGLTRFGCVERNYLLVTRRRMKRREVSDMATRSRTVTCT